MISEIKQKSIMEKKACCLQYRSTMEWAGLNSQADLDKMSAGVMGKYRNGDFFLERIGRFKEVDISLSLTIMGLREQWIAEAGINTIQEFMLLDMIFIAYFHFIRLNEMINNLMANIEWDIFALDAPQLKTSQAHDKEQNKVTAEATAWRIREALEPVLEQYSRMFTRNVKTLNGTKRGILSYFGQDHTLDHKIFRLNPCDWMVPVLISYKKLENEYKRLGLKTSQAPQGQNDEFGAIRTKWGRLWDMFRTVNWHEIESELKFSGILGLFPKLTKSELIRN